PGWAPARPTGMATTLAGDAEPDAAQPNLRRRLRLRASPARRQAEGVGGEQERAAAGPDVGVESVAAGSPPGLHHLGALPGEPGADAAEPLAPGDRRGAPRRGGAVDAAAGVRHLRPLPPRPLPRWGQHP